MKIKFVGGVQTVTGSMFCIDDTLLIEAGLYQGHRAEAERINRNPDIDIAKIKGVFITHAHLDHSGNIPNLVKKGYKGPVFATPATIDIASLLLLDAAHIFEQDLKYLNKKLRKRGLPEKEPLYTVDDAREAIKLFTPLNYHKTIEVNGYQVTLFDAGHILGSAQIRLQRGGTKLLASGDLGRTGMPFLRNPEFGVGADVLLLESTYGGRFHDPADEVAEKLKQLIINIYDNRARLLIPAFAVERTQDLLYILSKLQADIPPVPIYVDSPLASNVTNIFRQHRGLFDKETKKLLSDNQDPLGFERLHFTRNVGQSKALNREKGPVIIISASGMCEGGRVLHHLKQTVSDPDNVILFVGFQARNTLGRRIIEGAKHIKIFGDEFKLKCQVEEIDGMSSHADSNGLVKYAKAISDLKMIFLVHGEKESGEALRKHLLDEGFTGTIRMPEISESFAF